MSSKIRLLIPNGLTVPALSLLAVVGCTNAAEEEGEPVAASEPEVVTFEVRGKLASVPFEEVPSSESEPCWGVMLTRTFHGSQVTLLDGSGSILGIGVAEGWGDGGEGEGKLGTPGKWDSPEGLCYWDFSIEGIESESDFFKIEYGNRGTDDIDLSREQLLNSPTIVLGNPDEIR